MTFRMVTCINNLSIGCPVILASDSPSTQISDRFMAHLYLLWALGDTEPRNRLQLIQRAPRVPQTTSADHWHLVDRITVCPGTTPLIPIFLLP